MAVQVPEARAGSPAPPEQGAAPGPRLHRRRGRDDRGGFVLVEDGKIAAVGPAAELGSGGEGAFEVGGAGKTVLPGLFNNHAHLAWDGANDLATQSLEDPPEISAYKCASNMARSLAAGVTTVRDLGMNKSNLFAKQAIVQGVIRGRSCSSPARRSSRPAATRTGAAGRRRAPTRCGARCASRCGRAPT